MKQIKKMFMLLGVSLIVLGISSIPISFAQQTDCADMYSNKQGLYMVSEIDGESELRSDLYQEFWGIEDLKHTEERGNCYFWMIAWIWS